MPLSKDQYVSDVWKDGIFDNKVVFCTGGSGTICSAQVRALVHLGANACIVGRNKEKVETVGTDIETCRSGSKVLAIGDVDVRKIESLEAAVERCVNELGGIDYVIAGAAGNFLAPISAISPNAMKSVIDIDVLGSYHTLKATLPHLLKSASSSSSSSSTPSSPSSSPSSSPASSSYPQPPPLTTSTTGRIIFVSATLHYTGTPLQSHVSMAKAAVDSLSASTALEYGPLGLRSNVIAPGPIADTEGMARLSRQEDRERALRGVPVQRWGSVREIADATVFLLSETGGFVNGAEIVVDGGAWRMGAGGIGGGGYPEYLVSGREVEGVKGGKRGRDGSKL